MDTYLRTCREDIRRQKGDKEAEVVALESTSPESIWLSDLDELDTVLVERNKCIEAKNVLLLDSIRLTLRHVRSILVGELTFSSLKVPCGVMCWRMSIGHVLDAFVTDNTKGEKDA